MTSNSEKWIESLPNEWSITKIGNHFKCRNEKVNDTDYPPLSVAKQGVVPQIETVAKTDANDNRKLVLTNDFVINSRSDRKESCGLSKLNGSVSLINHVLYQNGQDYYMPFVGILFKNYGFAEEFYRWGHGIVADLWTTRWQEMKNIEIPLPPLKEQKLIFDFLTNRTSKIDQLISNQEKQVEKLKEYRQAVITKAVTKGLDPNVPMKDSGIEWIGEIPNNVNVSSVKNFYDITLGKMLQPKQENENDTLEYYFCAANLGNDCLKTNDLKQMWFSVKEKEKYSLKRGDLLVVEGGDVASSSIISTDVSNIYFQNSIHRVRPIHGLNEYLHYYLIFVKGSGYFDVNCNKATIMHFTKDKFSNLPFLIRNTEEQKKIVTFLNKEETKINRLIWIKEKKIEFLTNYKKSLIYEYVTGKKRVSL